jgi:hypothetical protein
MAITTGLGIYDGNSQAYANSYAQQMSRYDYERMRHEEEARYRQMQMMHQPLPGDKPVSNEKQPNPVLLLLKA